MQSRDLRHGGVSWGRVGPSTAQTCGMPDSQPGTQTLRWLEGLVTGSSEPEEPGRQFADILRNLDTDDSDKE